MRAAAIVLGFIASLGCLAAGVYLLVMRSGAAENAGVFDATAIDVLSHAIGIYFIAKGLSIASRTMLELAPKR